MKKTEETFQNIVDNIKDFSELNSNDMEKAAKQIKAISIELKDNLSESLKKIFEQFTESLNGINSNLENVNKNISALEELVKFQKECDYSLILGNRQALVEDDSVIDLMIYDDYVE